MFTGQTGEQRTPRRVGQRGKGAIEESFRKLNHEVKFSNEAGNVKTKSLYPGNW